MTMTCTLWAASALLGWLAVIALAVDNWRLRASLRSWMSGGRR